MPSPLHEMFVEFVRERPEFVADILTGPLKLDLPDFRDTRLDSVDFTGVVPTEYRADAVVTFTDTDRPVFAVVVEVQLSAAPRKRLTWPVYVATLRARLDCATALLVLCNNAVVARWCAQPIEVAYPDCVLTPLVLGPELVPVVTDRAEARRCPEMVVLSTIAHGANATTSGQRQEIILALLTALQEFDRDHQRLYYDLAFASLPAQATRDLKEVMMAIAAEPEFRSEFLRTFFEERYAEGEAHGRAEGEAHGRAEGEAHGQALGEARALITVLEVRGIDLPETARDRIRTCTDLDQLDLWIHRAPVVSDVDELFAP